MSDVDRVKKVIKWLLFIGVAENETGLAEKINYNTSSFSQIVNGKTKISKKFIENLCRLNEKLNSNWVLTGIGEMLRNGNDEDKPEIQPSSELEYYKSQLELTRELLKEKTKYIDMFQPLIDEMLKEMLERNKTK